MQHYQRIVQQIHENSNYMDTLGVEKTKGRKTTKYLKVFPICLSSRFIGIGHLIFNYLLSDYVQSIEAYSP